MCAMWRYGNHRPITDFRRAAVRDRDADTNGSLDERLYAAHNANWNVTSIINTSAAVQERFIYDPFGTPSFKDGSYGTRSASSFAWAVLHQGGRKAEISGMQAFGNREFTSMGVWLTIDPIGLRAGDSNLYRYEGNSPIVNLDPSGTQFFFLRPTPMPMPMPVRPIVRPMPGPPMVGRPIPPVAGPLPIPPGRVGIPEPAPRPFPGPQPIKPGDPPRPGDGVEPPGDCPWDEYVRLRHIVKVYCRKLPGAVRLPDCQGNTFFLSCDELGKRAKRHTECADARKQIMDKCFRGGDSDHWYWYNMERYWASVCWWKYDYWRCGCKGGGGDLHNRFEVGA
jgi:RHS repeat-associated protein